jgi:hypothetical protein
MVACLASFALPLCRLFRLRAQFWVVRALAESVTCGSLPRAFGVLLSVSLSVSIVASLDRVSCRSVVLGLFGSLGWAVGWLAAQISEAAASKACRQQPRALWLASRKPKALSNRLFGRSLLFVRVCLRVRVCVCVCARDRSLGGDATFFFRRWLVCRKHCLGVSLLVRSLVCILTWSVSHVLALVCSLDGYVGGLHGWGSGWLLA